ncbi:toll-like receptor 3 [Mytilus edulis]|uniref:toll-like receptor 3 n=1 Tax=Mytilus edulis TaxID=6550 RepID=UPI0039F082BB
MIGLVIFKLQHIFPQFILVYILLHVGSSSIPCLEPYCECSSQRKEATCTNLTFIPRLPDYVKNVYFKGNKFTNVTRHFMLNVTKTEIRHISLVDNSIEHFSRDTLYDLKWLRNFEISAEPKVYDLDVRSAFFKLKKDSISIVRFEDNNWKILPPDLFFGQTNITEASFSGNKAQRNAFVVFAPLQKLRLLNMSRNSLTTFDLQGQCTLKIADLSKNYIDEFQNFCCGTCNRYCCQSHGCKSKSPNLRVLDLGSNSLSILESSYFYCLPSLEILILNSNRFISINDNAFVVLPSLQKLYIEKNQQITTIGPAAFNISTLRLLSLAYNNFRFDSKLNIHNFDPNSIFKYFLNLEVLNLGYNFLASDSDTSILIFKHLPNLITLNLENMRLNKLPSGIFSKMVSLESLNLQGNIIRYWPDGTFDKFINLKFLNLQKNQIQLLNKTSIKSEVLQRLLQFDLSNNPLMCTCDLMWFRNWIKKRNTSFLSTYPQGYKCAFPENLQDTLLEEYNPTEDICTPWDPLFTMILVLSTSGFFILILMFSVYKCHTNIRNYLYLFRLHRLQKDGSLQLDNSEDFAFHAFVVYCDADREWVHASFVKRIEHEGIRLCIHHRNFDAGVPISENVDKYMTESWKVVIIMSNNFAESEWCQWECDCVQERRRHHGKGGCVLIMLRTIDANHMTSSIKTLLQTTPYLRFKEGVGEEIFWQAIIDALRKPLSVPPMAI